MPSNTSFMLYLPVQFYPEKKALCLIYHKTVQFYPRTQALCLSYHEAVQYKLIYHETQALCFIYDKTRSVLPWSTRFMSLFTTKQFNFTLKHKLYALFTLKQLSFTTEHFSFTLKQTLLFTMDQNQNTWKVKNNAYLSHNTTCKFSG